MNHIQATALQPNATVTVFLTNTTTKATIFADNTQTPLSNPFTADASGNWSFFAPPGSYDVEFSGAGISTPFFIKGLGQNVVPTSYLGSGFVNVIQNFGAKGDGIADDTTPIQNAINSVVNGGTVWFPPGTYKTTRALTVVGVNITLDGSGATIMVTPTPPLTNNNNRGMYIAGNYPQTSSPIVGSIPLGQTFFTAQNTADANSLSPNDWITIWEIDNTLGDIVFYDQHQVLNVAPPTVNLLRPIRTAFPGTHSTVQFKHITTLTHEVTVRNLTIICPTLNVAPCITIAEGTRGIVIDNCTLSVQSGPALTTYRTGSCRVVNSRLLNGTGYTEFGAAVDCCIENNVFDWSDNNNGGNAPVALDFGFGFSTFCNNVITHAGSYGFIMWHGVHDCSISGNTIGWVRGGTGSQAHATGISCAGGYNNSVVGNVLIGGDGYSLAGSNIAIACFADTGGTPQLPSQGNRIGPNTINIVTGFGYSSLPEQAGSSFSSGDIYLDTTNNQSWTQPLLNIYTAWLYAGRILQLTDNAANNPYVLLQSTGAAWSVNGGTDFEIRDSTQQVLRFYDSAKGVQFWGWPVIYLMASGSRSVVTTDYTPNPIPAGSVATIAISVPGATTGAVVSLNFTASMGNLIWSGAVLGPDTVTVSVANPTTAAIAPPAGTWIALVMRTS